MVVIIELAIVWEEALALGQDITAQMQKLLLL